MRFSLSSCRDWGVKICRAVAHLWPCIKRVDEWIRFFSLLWEHPWRLLLVTPVLDFAFALHVLKIIMCKKVDVLQGSQNRCHKQKSIICTLFLLFLLLLFLPPRSLPNALSPVMIRKSALLLSSHLRRLKFPNLIFWKPPSPSTSPFTSFSSSPSPSPSPLPHFFSFPLSSILYFLSLSLISSLSLFIPTVSLSHPDMACALICVCKGAAWWWRTRDGCGSALSVANRLYTKSHKVSYIIHIIRYTCHILYIICYTYITFILYNTNVQYMYQYRFPTCKLHIRNHRHAHQSPTHHATFVMQLVCLFRTLKFFLISRCPWMCLYRGVGDERSRDVCDAQECGRVHYANPNIVVGAVCLWEGKVRLTHRDFES